MEDYRRKHAEIYLQRQKEREEEERRIQEEEQRKDMYVQELTSSLQNAVAECPTMVSLTQVLDMLRALMHLLQQEPDVWRARMEDEVRLHVMDILQAINGNVALRVSFSSILEVQLSRDIHSTMNAILKTTNIIQAAEEDLSVEIHMDCSRDEEIARQLQEEGELTTPRLRFGNTRSRAPRRVQPRRRRVPDAAAAEDEDALAIPLPEPIKKKVVHKKKDGQTE